MTVLNVECYTLNITATRSSKVMTAVSNIWLRTNPPASMEALTEPSRARFIFVTV